MCVHACSHVRTHTRPSREDSRIDNDSSKLTALYEGYRACEIMRSIIARALLLPLCDCISYYCRMIRTCANSRQEMEACEMRSWMRRAVLLNRCTIINRFPIKIIRVKLQEIFPRCVLHSPLSFLLSTLCVSLCFFTYAFTFFRESRNLTVNIEWLK